MNLISKYFTNYEDLPFRKKSFLDDIMNHLIALKLNTKLDLKKETENLKKVIFDIGKKIEFPSFQFKTEIKNEDIEELQNELYATDFNYTMENFLKLIFNFFSSGKENRKKGFLSEMFFGGRMKLLDKNGSTIAKTGSEKNNEKYNLYEMFHFVKIYFKKCFSQIDKKFDILKEMQNAINDSDILDQSDKVILQFAIKKFLEKDFISFMTLAVPRVENILRNILEKNGINIIGKMKQDGSNYKMLGELIDDEFFKEKFSDDFLFCFKFIFIDEIGLNLRNKISHGLSDYRELDEGNSNFVFIILHFLITSKL